MADPDVLTWPTRLGGLLALLAASTATALEVSPLRLNLRAEQAQGELWLHNDSAQPWRGQARVYQWTQTTQAELLQPADTLVVSPAELDLPAHARQRVRVVRLGPAPTHEQGYRLVLRAGADSPPVQLSLPVFVLSPEAGHGPLLSVRLLDDRDPAVLELYNGGPRHARLADLSFVPAKGAPRPLLPGLSGYVLAGQTRHWTLPGPATAYRDGRFSARLGEAPAQLLDPPAPSIAPGPAAGL